MTKTRVELLDDINALAHRFAKRGQHLAAAIVIGNMRGLQNVLQKIQAGELPLDCYHHAWNMMCDGLRAAELASREERR
jgi:hypothetical protein